MHDKASIVVIKKDVILNITHNTFNLYDTKVVISIISVLVKRAVSLMHCNTVITGCEIYISGFAYMYIRRVNFIKKYVERLISNNIHA
jgi:hypothetical protein